jgi:hypothetical protein
VFQKEGIVPKWKMERNFIAGLIDTRVFRRNVDKPDGTLLNCLESLAGLGRDFAKMVLFQSSGGSGCLSKKPRKSL